MFQKFVKQVSRLFQGSVRVCFKSGSRFPSGNYKDVKMKFRGCLGEFKGVSVVLSGSFMGPSKECQGDFML